MRRFLKRHRRIALDTSCFIYHVEEHHRYLSAVEPLFRSIESGDCQGVTSILTLTELLILPYREDRQDLLDDYFALLPRFPNLDWIAPDLWICDRAAQLRANQHLKTPDALQAATALTLAATGFVTNDPVFRRIDELDVLLLDDVVAGRR